MVIKRRKLGEVNFLGRSLQPSFKHKHSQPIFGFSPMRVQSRSVKKQPIRGYPGLNMFSSLAIPKRSSTSMWTPHSRPAASMWGDSDGDGVYNEFDCQPRNRRMQGPEHKRKNVRKILRQIGQIDIGRMKHTDPRIKNTIDKLNETDMLALHSWQEHKTAKEEIRNERRGLQMMQKDSSLKGQDLKDARRILKEEKERGPRAFALVTKNKVNDKIAKAERRERRYYEGNDVLTTDAWSGNLPLKEQIKLDKDTAKMQPKIDKSVTEKERRELIDEAKRSAVEEIDYMKEFEKRNFDGVEFGEIPYEERRDKAEKEWKAKGSPTPEYDYEEDYDKAEGRAEKRRMREHEDED